MHILEIVFENQLIALFTVIGAGLLLGNITVKGINLGSSGVLFSALLAGHLGLEIPGGVGNFGLALFVYCVGIGAGPRFFPALAREGGGLAKLGFIIVASGAAIAWGLGRALDLPADLSVGLFAGALTSTPALAAASEAGGATAQAVAIGYGIAYPLGVIGVVLFVQLVPRLLKPDPEEQQADDVETATQGVQNVLVEISNANLVGRRIEEDILAGYSCQISRILRNGRLVPLGADETLAVGQTLLVVGRPRDTGLATTFLGKRSEETFVADTENERERLVVTDKKVGGRSLRELALLRNFGVVITRISRLGQEFVPTPEARLETYDVLTSVGQADDLKKFSKYIGHRPQAFDQTDLISMALGLSAGIFVGMVPISLPGGSPMTLGLAGGPLFVALVLGYFGRVGRVVGHIPRPTRMLLQELGLVLFLANAGIVGGGSLAVTIQEYGAIVFAIGAAITIGPVMIAYPVARKILGLSQAQALGGICGGMTSTPALGALTSASSSQQPIVSYATAYPVSLITMTVMAKLLLQLMGG